MLKLTRREGESFYIGDKIKIEILSGTTTTTTVLGIHAPEEVRILRDDAVKRDIPKRCAK